MDEATVTADGLQSLTMRFEQRCDETGPPLRGFLRYDAEERDRATAIG